VQESARKSKKEKERVLKKVKSKKGWGRVSKNEKDQESVRKRKKE
jgi:hypothetical protein